MTLTFDLLTLKVVSGSRVTWATSVPILAGLSVLDLGPMYATDRQTDVRWTDVRQHHLLMPRLLGAGHNNAVWSNIADVLEILRMVSMRSANVSYYI